MRKTVNGTKTLYVHDGEHIVQELDASEALQATFRYGPGLDQPLTMERGGQTYWYLADSLGSIVALTDASGDVVETYRYDAFGETVILDGTGSPLTVSAFDNPWMSTGRQFDPETGLYHYRARAYSAALGRFLQRDPLDQLPDTNVYRYVDNQPLDLVDPFGLMSEKCSGSNAAGILSSVQFGLGLLGMLPGIGEPFDIINSLISFATGNEAAGAASLVSALPFVGSVVAVAVGAVKVYKDGGQSETRGKRPCGKSIQGQEREENCKNAAEKRLRSKREGSATWSWHVPEYSQWPCISH